MDNAEFRRQLKHQTVNLCKDDDQCSSCLLPCRDFSLDNTTCFESTCKDSTNLEACKASCVFLADAIKKRPGECPNSIPVRLDECAAACDRDGDCPGAEKCCSAGCSRLCVAPVVQDSRLLPIPEGITVQERKRKRSAVVRWVMKRLSKAHMSTNSNLYVIQWRWGTRREEETMTPWQTVMVKNKMYAILKHLLMPGRYYIFRVAAVNQFGSLGFSQPSSPFKLSKEVRAPSAPKNLTVESLSFDENLMKWIPKLSWNGLEVERVYMVELFATVDSTEGELRGEPAVIFIRTNSTNMVNDAESVRYDVKMDKKSEVEPTTVLMTQTTTKPTMAAVTSTKTTQTTLKAMIGFPLKDFEVLMTEDEEEEPRFDLDIQTPYFDGGKLKTSISWIDSPACSPTKSVFVVRLTPKKCDRLQTRTITATQCVILIDQLNFDCEYEVEVDDVQNRKVVSRAFFQTLSCETTPSTEPLACSGPLPSKPRCKLLSETSAVCDWTVPDDPSIIGYRTILSSPVSTAKIGVASTHSPKMEYQDLVPGTDYRFRLQPVTNKGLSTPVDIEFSTRSNFSQDHPRRLDKFPILELPLESAAPAKLRESLFLILTVIFIRF
uniref:Anosmin-1 n=1 Tax=Panagrolaimus sp. JU765 TaxID=591449 RepID=A0AC34Q1H3_9BILA